MSSTTPIPPRPERFSDLAFKPQLFLWTVRHMIVAIGNQRPLCPHVQQTFNLAHAPSFPLFVEELLYTVAQYATRRIEFAPPHSQRVLIDEARFVACLEALMVEPVPSGNRHLNSLIRRQDIGHVMPIFAAAASSLNRLSSTPAALTLPVLDHQPFEVERATLH